MNSVQIVAREKDKFYDFIAKTFHHLGIKVVTSPDLADFTTVLGGDGSLLAAARKGIKSPVLVINAGHLGFLTSSDKEHALETIERVLLGEFSITERHLLSAVFGIPGSDEDEIYLGMNEAVVRPISIKLVQLTLYAIENCDEKVVANYRADGLIIATPTGSTAYSLSASGPIIHPSCRSFCVTPICPQGLTQRPLVLPHTTKLRIESQDHDLYLSMDGQNRMPMAKGTSVHVSYNAHSIQTINPVMSYYEVLQNKLGWGIRPVA